MLTSDVFRDNALTTVLEHGVLPNVGSPGMIRELRDAGYRGPIALRANPGFGHGHVQAVDTGGPSSKHGVWHEDLDEARCPGRRGPPADRGAARPRRHRPEGGRVRRQHAQADRLLRAAAAGVPRGRGGELRRRPAAPLPPRRARPSTSPATGRSCWRPRSACRRRPGARCASRSSPAAIPWPAWGCWSAGSRTSSGRATNSKGPGHTFVMVDAGFNDLVRPAMYGSYHHMSVVGAGAGRPPEPLVVAGPLCESGDVFTRDDHELLDPRPLPRPEPGDLLVLHDAGAYGASMSSNYVSLRPRPAGVLGRRPGHPHRPPRDDRRRHPRRVRGAAARGLTAPAQRYCQTSFTCRHTGGQPRPLGLTRA